MRQQNLFQKGIVSDLDPSVVANNSWSFPTQNIRIFNYDGQGYIATQVEGNHNDVVVGDPTNIGFKLTPNFFAIGCAEYNGVIYIISANSSDGNGSGEIGCFPSPDWDVSGTKRNEYQPLKNVFDDVYIQDRVSMTRAEFNFDHTHPIYDEIQIVPSYDDSVDIIFTDFKNPVRIVNSGFRSDWTITDRTIPASTFASSIALILQTETTPKISLQEITSGSLKYGNYIFFVRYADIDFNKSLFVAESNPISIFKGSSWCTIDIEGSVDGSNSTSGVKLSITNIDEKFKYLQFGYVRYYSDATQVLLWDVKLIDRYYDVTSASLDCNIFGTETTIDYTLDEIIKQNIQERTCKSLCVVDNRLYGANWKRPTVNHPYLEEISALIKLRYVQEESDAVVDWVNPNMEQKIRTDKTSTGTHTINSFADPFIVHDELSYMHGDAYAFGIVWKWKNNNVSDVYNNLVGYDHFFNAFHDIYPNNNGIYRFPHVGVDGTNHETVSYIKNPDGITRSSEVYKTGIKYDFTEVYNYLNSAAGADVKEWFDVNIESFVPVRAERNKNVLYQGISLECVSHPNGASKDNAAYFPYPHEQFPSIEEDAIGTRFTSGGIMLFKSGRFGFYSTDYLLENDHSVANEQVTYVSRLYNLASDSTGWTATIRLRLPDASPDFSNYSIYEQNCSVFASNPTNIYEIYNTVNVPFGISPSRAALDYSGFCSHATDYAHPSVGDSGTLFYEHTAVLRKSNRQLLSPAYIGCEHYVSGTTPFYRQICNLYKIAPNSIDYKDGNIINFYPDTQNLVYHKISDWIGVDNMYTEIFNKFYRGDVFLQRSYFKQSTWGPSYATCHDRGPLTCAPSGSATVVSIDPWAIGSDNLNSYCYGHGTLLGIITENTINSAYRVKGEDSTFYPAVGREVGVPGDYERHVEYWSVFPAVAEVSMNDYATCTKITGIESFIVNSGYSQVLSPTPHFTYNPGITYADENLITRIRFSSRLIVGSYINQLRTWDSLAYRDYDSKYGPITAIRQLYNKLVSVQQKAINEHIINERATIPNSQGEILLGSGDILSQVVRRLSDYGSDHNSSIKLTSSGIYGVSSLYQTIWKCGTNMSDSGSSYTGVIPLSTSKLISSKVSKYLDFISDSTSNNITDTPTDYLNDGCGLITGYDHKFGEVLFTFMFRKTLNHTAIVSPSKTTTHTLSITLREQTLANMENYFSVGDKFYIYYTDETSHIDMSSLITITAITANSISWVGDENVYINNEGECYVTLVYSRTIVYNEKFDLFTGEYTISPIMYFTKDNNFYSMPATIFYDSTGGVEGKVWQHNIAVRKGGVAAAYSNFYGEQYPFKLSFVVNGLSDGENSNMMMKHFNNIVIEGTNQPFDRMEYYTKNQYALHDWTVTYERPWLDPEYIEDGWRIPIATQTSSTTDGYEADANMRGRWLKVILTGTKAIQVFIKNILTNFTISNS